MQFLCFHFFLFFLGVREGFEYLVAVECIRQKMGRVAQHGLAPLLKQGSWVLLQELRIEHQPPKLGVVGSNPTSPATYLKKAIDQTIYLQLSLHRIRPSRSYYPIFSFVSVRHGFF
jgi:hypothetical protein